MDLNLVASRQHTRVTTKSIIVSLSDPLLNQVIVGFLRDVSEGGLKIQKMSAQRQVEGGILGCEFLLPELGKVVGQVELVGFGDEGEKFSEHLLRLRFVKIDKDNQSKIRQFVLDKQKELA